VGSVITCPIAHGEGNYFAQEQVIEELEAEQRIILRYCSEQGLVEPQSRDTNPNGSVHSIAGICNRERNVFGLMPHPERAATELIGGVGGSTGLAFLKSFM
jgi:phosphoribosylformylglycinamidine synthase